MKTVGEFLNAGLEFVKDDKCYKNGSSGDEFHRHWHEAPIMYSDQVVSKFAWRENTGVKPEFSGDIDAIIGISGDVERIECAHIDDFQWDLDHSCPTVEWRPSLNQPEQKEWPDNSRIDSIGQNGNDGLHYDNTAQQVEALAANHTLLQPRNPEPIFRTNEDAQKSLNEHLAKLAESKPIFTQAMADAGELPPVGSVVDVVGQNGVELFYGEGEKSCEVLAHVKNTAVIRMSFGLGCFSSDALKASDTRTDRENAVDAALALDEYRDGLGMMSRKDFVGKLYDNGLLKC